MHPDISVRTWIRASTDETRSGLLGYLSIRYGDLLLDGVVLRRTSQGRLALSFPARTDRGGRRHSFIRPIDDDARRAIEAALLGQLEVELET